MTQGWCMTIAQLSFWRGSLAQAMGIFSPAKGFRDWLLGLAAGLGLQPSDGSEPALMSLVPAGCAGTEVALKVPGGTHSPGDSFI